MSPKTIKKHGKTLRFLEERNVDTLGMVIVSHVRGFLIKNIEGGKDNNRLQLKEMLNYIREDDIIVMSELDRLGRNNKEITSIMNLI